MQGAVRSLLALLLLSLPAFAGGGPQNVLVVVNGRDPDSVRIGEHYRAARGIPPRNVVTLDLPTDLTTTLDVLKDRIEEPIKEHLARAGIRDHVDYVVLTRGLPILVRVPNGRASVAACLVVMDTPISGSRQRQFKFIPNPNHQPSGAFHHSKTYGGLQLYLVTMLTGFTAEDAMALVDRAVRAEEKPPGDALFVFQDARGNASNRNPRYAQGIQDLKNRGQTAEHQPAGGDKVVDRKRLMGYMSGGSYSGLNEKGIAGNEYLPGAICDMLESFGAVPRNFDPDRKPSQVPVTWFVRHGITGIHGAVAEPYSVTFPDVYLFSRYVMGMNLAESFHSSLPFLYWQNLVIGDPLCTPYARRPAVKLDGIPSGAARGTIELALAATAADPVKEVRLFVDGLLADRAVGSKATFAVDTTRLADGEHHVLAVAERLGDLEIQGWTVGTLVVENATPAVLAARTVTDDGPGGKRAIRMELSRPVRGTVTATVDGEAAPVETLPDEAAVLVRPAAAPAGQRVEIRLAGAVTGAAEYLVPPAALRVTAPIEVEAGKPAKVEVRPLDGEGKVVDAFAGQLAVQLSNPRVTMSERTVDTPLTELSVTPQTAGEVTLLVRDRLSGARGKAKIRVKPGPVADMALTPRVLPQGEPTQVNVALLDAYGNRVTEHEAEVRLSFPRDDRAEVPAAARTSGGTAVFRDVVLWRNGIDEATLSDASGLTIAQDRVRVAPFSIRSWLVLGPLPEAIPGNELADLAPSEGRPRAGKIWRRYRSNGDEIDLRKALGAGEGFAYAHVYVRLPEDGEVTLRLGWGTAFDVYVDGRKAFTAEKEEKKLKADREKLAGVRLAKGWHRILVVSRHGGASDTFQVRVSDDGGNAVAGLGRSVSSPERPGYIAGRVRSGGRGATGVTVKLAGPEEIVTSTDDQGNFAVGGLPRGRWSVVPSAEGLTATPPSAEVEVAQGATRPLTFEVKDGVPPAARIVSPEDGAKAASRLAVRAEATDNVAVTKVRLLVNGEEVGEARAAAPFAWDLDTEPWGTRTVELTVVAEDASGNRTESDGVKVKIIRDRHGPTIRIVAPPRNHTVTGKVTLTAEVEDEIGVAEVEFRVDHQLVGRTLSKPPFTVSWDATRAEKGSHLLTVTARDTEGNESKKSVRLKSR